jgi:hypothetical protein
MHSQDNANDGSIKWHVSNCNRYYRCWNGIALELTCPFIAPLFDSCRLQCVSDPNAVCGDPGPDNLCGNEQTTTTTTVSGDTTTTTTVSGDTTTTTEGNGIPTAPTAPSKFKEFFF